jgi:6-phosphogluconolactonase
LLIGTYTKGCSKGMYVYDFDSDTGDFNLKMFQNTINPSYLTVSDNDFVYSVNENGKESKVSAFSYTLPVN